MAETAGGRSEVWAVRLERANIWGASQKGQAEMRCPSILVT